MQHPVASDFTFRGAWVQHLFFLCFCFTGPGCSHGAWVMVLAAMVMVTVMTSVMTIIMMTNMMVVLMLIRVGVMQL